MNIIDYLNNVQLDTASKQGELQFGSNEMMNPQPSLTLGQSINRWLVDNSTLVYVGVGTVAMLALFSGRKR